MLEFNEEKHEYTLDGKKLISVTQLMQKHGLAPNYEGIDPEVLKRKAERGTLIHKEIENFIKKGDLSGVTDEAYTFMEFIKKTHLKPVESELMVHNDIVAGTIDLILEEGENNFIISDIKTTYSLHVESVSWQLSIYLWLWLDYDLREPDKNWDNVRAKALHFDNEGTLKDVDIPLQPVEEIKRLLECERTGQKFEVQVFDNYQLDNIEKMANFVSTIEQQYNEAKAKYEEMLDKIREQMESRGLKEFTRVNVKIECKGGKPASTRTTTTTTFDEEGFKAKDEKAYELYKSFVRVEKKVSPVKASPNKVTITILNKGE